MSMDTPEHVLHDSHPAPKACFFIPEYFFQAISVNETNGNEDVSTDELDTITQNKLRAAAVARQQQSKIDAYLKSLPQKPVRVASRAHANAEDFVPRRSRTVYDMQQKDISTIPGVEWQVEGKAIAEGQSINEQVAHCYQNLGIVYDFFAEVFKRDSLDNAGMPLIGSVNLDNNYANAFFSPQLEQMIFGYGFQQCFDYSETGVVSSPADTLSGYIGNFASSLDVVAHELMHAVTTYSVANGVGLDYNNESGALNESISDVFAVMVGHWHSHKMDPTWQAKDSDWLIGEDCVLPGHPGKALRSFIKPGEAYDLADIFVETPPFDQAKYDKAVARGEQYVPTWPGGQKGPKVLSYGSEKPTTEHDSVPIAKETVQISGQTSRRDPQVGSYDKKYFGSDDHGGVHINSGIPNKAFYLAATNLGGNSWEKPGQIWYSTLLDPQLGSKCTMYQFAILTINNAKALYGSDAETQVRAAWVAVKVLKK